MTQTKMKYTNMTYHFTPIREVKIKFKGSKCWQRRGKMESQSELTLWKAI